LPPNRIGPRLPNVSPLGYVDLLQVELENGVVGDGLDHPAHSTAGNDLLHEQTRLGIGRDLSCYRPQAEFIVVRARHGVNHTSWVAPQIVSLG
jgi:hypothetical protein